MATVCASHLPPRAVTIPIESGGDLAQRLRPCGLSLADHRHNGVGMRLGVGPETGVTAQDLPTRLGGGESGLGAARDQRALLLGQGGI